MNRSQVLGVRLEGTGDREQEGTSRGQNRKPRSPLGRGLFEESDNLSAFCGLPSFGENDLSRNSFASRSHLRRDEPAASASRCPDALRREAGTREGSVLSRCQRTC